MRMLKTFVACVVFMAIVSGTLAWMFFFPTPEIKCLALNIYKEARGESMRGQYGVAWVTKARALDNSPEFGGKDLCHVVYHKKVIVRKDKAGVERQLVIPQFSWTVGQAATKPTNQFKAWVKALFIAHHMSMVEQPPLPALKKARWYLNEAHSDPHSVCWFKKHLVPVTTIGHHQFYRRPTQDEAVALAALPEPKECIPTKK